MHIGKSKKPKPVDLLAMPQVERMKLIREVRQQLRQKAAEAKLWHNFIEADSVTINGNTVQPDKMPLRGMSLSDVWNHGC
jgi:hypothetical protein